MLRFPFSFDWRKSKAHWHLLSYFVRERTLSDLTRGDLWRSVLDEPPKKALDRFIKERLLAKADLAGHLAYKFKVSDLKGMLRQRGLKVSGRKEDLINRLVEADGVGAQRAVAGMSVLRVTDAGKALAEEYLAQEGQRRELAERAVVAALKAGRFDEASRAVNAFEAQQVFPRGLGIDWATRGTEHDVQQLRDIFHCRPKILAGLREEVWAPLRMAAGLSALWGTNTAQWLPKDIDTGIRLDRATAARMMLFWAYQQRDLRSYLAMEGLVNEVEIRATDDSCPACARLNGRRFRLADVPELPYEKCTSEMGCRCMLTPVIE